MIAGLRAAFKGAMGTHLSYDDLVALSAATLLNPERYLGDQLQGTFASSWQVVEGSNDWGAFAERWRTKWYLPLLRTIADQPIWGLQRRKALDLLFDEEERLTASLKLLQLPTDHAEAFLVDYQHDLAAELNVEQKRNLVGLDACFQMLSVCALRDIATRAFGATASDLETALDLHRAAFEFIFRLQVVVRCSHTIDAHCSLADSRALGTAASPVFIEMREALTAMRRELSDPRPNLKAHKEELRKQYNAILRAQDSFIRDILGQEPQTEYIEERDIA